MQSKPRTAVAGREHVAPFEPVGRVPGDREQQNSGQKLRQPHIAKIERPLGDLVDLPSTATACISTAETMRNRAIWNSTNPGCVKAARPALASAVAGMNFYCATET